VYGREDKTGADERVGEKEMEEDLTRTVKCVMSFKVLSLKNVIRDP
jgi:hypothetical protein